MKNEERKNEELDVTTVSDSDLNQVSGGRVIGHRRPRSVKLDQIIENNENDFENEDTVGTVV